MKRIMCVLLMAVSAVIAAVLISMIFAKKDGNTAPMQESITLYRCNVGKIINVSYEEFMVGCMFAEVSPAYGDEALKAAACVINSRCLYLLQSGERVNGADVSDTQFPWMSPKEAEEEYGQSYDTYLKKLTSAVEYGMQRALFYDEKLIAPAMCAYSTGRTEDGGVPYLSPKTLPSDKDNAEALSTAAFSSDTIRRTLTELTGVSSLSARPAEWFSNAVYTDGGTLSEVRFGGARLTGGQLRDAFDLRSAAITVEYVEERFLFTVRGYGGNTGMSLNAAADMSRSGNTAEDILEFFYSPAEVQTIYAKS